MNPILPTPDAADPHIELVGDRYYVYATNAGVWQHTDAFHRGDASQHGHAFVAWSSSDLVQWRNEGVILGFGDVDWARGLKDAWAPCLATRNGRCYFYFCAQSRIGVAVGDGPAGPFRDALGEPLVPFEPDLNSIDPMVFTDDDGQAYLYWGAVPASWLHGQVETIYSNLWVAKLNPDMVSFDGPAVATLETPPNPKGHNGYGPHIEASHVIKRDGVYYLMYSQGNWNDVGDSAYHVRIATAPHPLGPWTKQAEPVLVSHPERDILGPGHHSTLQLPGTDSWLICYHCHSGRKEESVPRRVCLDELKFEGATMLPVEPTREGVEAHPIKLGLEFGEPGPFAVGQKVPLQLTRQNETGEVEWGAMRDGAEVELEVAGAGAEWQWRPDAPGFYRIWARQNVSSDGAGESAPLLCDVV